MLIPPESAIQHGCFTYAQAWAVGWNYGLLASAVRRGHLHHVRRGVWIEAALWDGLDARGRHIVEVRADLLILRSGWFADRRSSAAVLGVPLLGAMPRKPQLVTVHDLHTTTAFRRSLALLPSHTAVRDGIPLTTLARTVIDLAREEPFLDAVIAADAFLALGLPVDLLEEVMRSLPESPAARQVIAFADGLSESALESMSRVRIHQHQLPPPELQVEIYRGRRLVARVDKLWRAQRTVGEDDGMAKFGTSSDEVRANLRRTYDRGLDIEDCGLALTRWDWNAALRDNGALVAERVKGAFARGARCELAPDVRFVPTTVADRLRREHRLAS